MTLEGQGWVSVPWSAMGGLSSSPVGALQRARRSEQVEATQLAELLVGGFLSWWLVGYWLVGF